MCPIPAFLVFSYLRVHANYIIFIYINEVRKWYLIIIIIISTSKNSRNCTCRWCNEYEYITMYDLPTRIRIVLQTQSVIIMIYCLFPRSKYRYLLYVRILYVPGAVSDELFLKFDYCNYSRRNDSLI